MESKIVNERHSRIATRTQVYVKVCLRENSVLLVRCWYW